MACPHVGCLELRMPDGLTRARIQAVLAAHCSDLEVHLEHAVGKRGCPTCHALLKQGVWSRARIVERCRARGIPVAYGAKVPNVLPACSRCRRRKVSGCDGNFPCNHCTASGCGTLCRPKGTSSAPNAASVPAAGDATPEPQSKRARLEQTPGSAEIPQVVTSTAAETPTLRLNRPAARPAPRRDSLTGMSAATTSTPAVHDESSEEILIDDDAIPPMPNGELANSREVMAAIDELKLVAREADEQQRNFHKVVTTQRAIILAGINKHRETIETILTDTSTGLAMVAGITNNLTRVRKLMEARAAQAPFYPPTPFS